MRLLIQRVAIRCDSRRGSSIHSSQTEMLNCWLREYRDRSCPTKMATGKRSPGALSQSVPTLELNGAKGVSLRLDSFLNS